MISRNYLSAQENPIYRVGLRDYARIKDWLEKCKQNYQNRPTPSPSIEYYPLNYVFTFKRITLSQNFIDKYLRTVNNVASNGLKILAGVFNSKQNIYIAKSYEKKGLFCKFDIRSRVIQLFDEIILAFFTLGERQAGTHYSVMTDISPNVKELSFVIQFDLISNDGQIFHLGQIKYSLTNRHAKQTVSDLEIVRLGEKQNIGYAECHIETPDRLGLSYFLPANYIIDPTTLVPPCKSIKVKDKTAPYTLLPSYNICIEDLEISINNYDKLLHSLKRCSPYFTNQHHDNIKIQISKITMLMGFHNSYMLLNDLPMGRDKQKQRLKLRESPKNSPGKSRVFNSLIESKEIKKNLRNHFVYRASKMVISQGNQNNIQTKNLTLKVYQQNLNVQGSQFIMNEPKTSIDLIYFDTDGGHLIGVLQFTIKFTLQAIIKQQKTMKMNIFWTPLTFDAGEPITEVKIPMIEHIELPGYPIEWSELTDNKNMISAILNYRCINNNPQLWQNVKKQRIRTFKTISGTHIPTQNEVRQKTYYDILIQQLDQKEKQENRSNLIANNMLKTQSAFRAYTQTSLVMKEEQVNNSIQKMLRTLQRGLKPRLKLRQNQFGISPDLLIPKLLQAKPVSGLFLVGKSYQINIRLRQYLPMTDSLEEYYIPRKMLIKIYGFRQIYEQIVFIDKDSVKAGIPIQLQHPTKVNYESFVFQFNLDNITREEAGAYEEGNSIIILINDLQNMLYYGSGEYPSIQLFDQNLNKPQTSEKKDSQSKDDSIKQEKKENLQQNSKYIRVKINSKLVNDKSSIRGYLLMQSTIVQKKQGQQANSVRPQQIKLQKLVKQISTKQRQMLRINIFNGKQEANTKKEQLINNYKKKNKQNFVKQIALKEYNNDLQIDYEIGKPTYAWIKLNNTDKSQNNLFAFYLDCDFIQIVTDKQVYQRQSLVEAKKGGSQNWKNMPNIAYILNKQGRNPGHYQTRILQGTQSDILIKVLHNQWTPLASEVTIAKIEVRRNTFPFKQFKLRLNLKKPLIDRAYHIQTIWRSGSSQIKVKIPSQIGSESGDFISTLSPNSLINAKENILILSKISQQGAPQQGLIIYVLLGAYSDKLCQNLRRNILIELQCMQGEKIKTNIGELQRIKIPIMSENLRVNQSIYRIQISNDEYQLKWQKYGRLNYYSKSTKNQPQLILRCLKPVKDDITVSIINLQNKLIKKYLIALQCTIPTRTQQYIIQIQGFVGEKINFIFKNLYQTDFGFYISSTNSGLLFHGIEFEKKQREEQFIFKIKSKSQIRITAQIIRNLRDEEYVILSDFLHRVVTIYIIRIRPRKQHEKMRQKLLQQDYIPFFGNNRKDFLKLE